VAQAAATLEMAQGAGHGGDHDYAEHPPTSLGIDHRKVAMWVFLASDCMFFGCLIAVYLMYRGRTEALVKAGLGKGPVPANVLDIPYTSVSAFVLLMSSLTMVLALSSVQRGNVRGTRIWLLATALLGTIFVGGQAFEFSGFYHDDHLGLTTNMFGTTFYTLTGFHGTHVTIGIIMLFSLAFLSFKGGITKRDAITVEIIGLYWHFVDIVWVIIFTLVYLVPYEKVETAKEGAGQVLRHIGLG
jgi:heme/copper-type cytochrome/quinol oxidase subunit 3